MPDEIKYRIIKGRGEEEEKEIKTSKELSIRKEKIKTEEIPQEEIVPTFKIEKKEPVPEPVPELKPIEIPEPTPEELIKTEIRKSQKEEYRPPTIKIPEIEIKPSYKINKKIITLLTFLILIPFIVYGGLYFFNKFKVAKKETQEKIQEKTENEVIITIFKKTTTTEPTSTTYENITTTSLPELAEATITPPIATTTETTTTTTETTTTATETTAVATETKTKEVPKVEEKKLEPPSPKPEEIKEVRIEDIEKQGTKTVFPYLKLPEINIDLDELTINDFRLKWLYLMKIQKSAGSLYKVNFYYKNQLLPAEFIKNYFLTPSFIEEKYKEAFKNALEDHYLILIYYTYTRKFPIIIFMIKNDSVVVPFMRLWDKESLLNDFKNLYLGLPKGKLIRFYTVTEEYEGIKYKIAYYDNDYKFIWTIYNNNLIISTSLNAFKYIIKNLK